MSFGAPLEEVWGSDLETHPKRDAKRRSTKAPQQGNDPLFCDLSSATKKLDDIMNYFESSPQHYDKNPTSRSQDTLPMTDGEPRGEANVYPKGDAVFDMPKDRKVFIEKFDEQKSREKQYLDFALYVFSGIVLIFVLEQFIQIGINLQRRLN